MASAPETHFTIEGRTTVRACLRRRYFLIEPQASSPTCMSASTYQVLGRELECDFYFEGLVF